ncbi:hypothetical protein [Spirulina sp. 06S082]|uniref:hypothetical protein n=1 Tax=Spirulina sp. 06S082 TaxID=3110248 RepID=UPI002B1F801C|nr:hypothetical protein [Spirulina sp. 06S082]MEA5470594.1 hypothetical protein [Spirulina sp. 06S082]
MIFLATFIPSSALALSLPSHQVVCKPQIDPAKPQYIVAYGSLMAKASRNSTISETQATPIWIDGFERGWFYRSSVYSHTAPMTYLGAIAQPNAHFNAILVRIGVSVKRGIENLDRRETNYCRQRVKRDRIKPWWGAVQLGEPDAQIWIYYVQKPQPPNVQYPIFQSYLDITLSGAIEIDPTSEFGQQFIQTTTYWSSFWVNDRPQPERAIETPIPRIQIDRILGTTAPTNRYILSRSKRRLSYF